MKKYTYMIRWFYKQEDLWTYKLSIGDEFGNLVYTEWEVSSPVMSMLLELLMDYSFAMKINKTVFDLETLNADDQMDLSLLSLHKLEDIDND